MAKEIKDFLDIQNAVMEVLKVQAGDTTTLDRIKRDINTVYLQEVVPYKNWKWRDGETVGQTAPVYATGTAAVSNGSATVTLSNTISASRAGYFITFGGSSEIYKISAHTAGSATLTLDVAFTGATDVAASFKIWKDTVALPTDLDEAYQVVCAQTNSVLQPISESELESLFIVNPTQEGAPRYFTVTDYYDPTPNTPETEADRYRQLRVYPSMSAYTYTLRTRYKKEVSALDLDGDEPIIPIHDRVVLVYGALGLFSWSRERNPEESARNEQHFYRRLAKMAGKIEAGQERPKISMARYRASAYRDGRVGSNGPGLGGGGGGAVGESNTASNVNAAGEGIFKQKVGVDLQFKGIDAGSNKVTVTADSVNNTIDVDVAEANLDLANIGGTLPKAKLPALTTDDIAEGTKLYYTEGRVSANSDVAANTAARHTHSNQSTLDATTAAFTAAKDADLAANTTARHSHANKALLDTYTQTEVNLADAVSKKHTHTNQALLDSYTQTEVNLADAVAKKHSHANQAILDATQESYSTAEKTKLAGIAAGATANQTDAYLLSRTNHTGTQLAATISDLGTASFNTSTGHDHDGTDSKKVIATNLDATGATTGQVLKYDGANVVWGAAGGAGGINFVGLNSSWALSSSDDRDFESSVGQWTAYADAAGTSPVDATGGAPNTTITRDTTNKLNGTASGLISVSSGATRQGEGVSCVFNIPEAYRGKKACIKFPFKVVSGTVSEDDFVTYVYDVTNAQLITPFRVSKLLGSAGTVLAYFDVPTNMAQGRLAIHVARATNTGAVTIAIDDVEVGPNSVTYSMAGSDTLSDSTLFTPSPAFGTTSAASFFYARVGDRLVGEGYFTAGTVAASDCYLTLKSGLRVDSAKATGGSRARLGEFNRLPTANTTIAEGALWFDGTNTDRIYLGVNSATGGNTYEKRVGSGGILANGDGIVVRFNIPISGWAANAQMSESTTWRASNYLAGKSPVTSTPASLGQYRTYVKAINAMSGTDTTPTTLPTSADGMLIYGNVSWGSAGTSGQAGRYEIYVGKNKNVKFEFYKNSGRSGAVCVDRIINRTDAGTLQEVGLNYSYDPSSGLVIVDGFNMATGQTDTRGAGIDIPTGGAASTDFSTPLASVYFDVVVSENALMVASESTVLARYKTATAQSLANSTETVINFDTKGFDTHLAVATGASWKFTAPQSGYYEIAALLTFAATANNGRAELSYYVNGVQSAYLGRENKESGTGSINLNPQGSDIVYLNAGDYLDIRCNQNTGAALALNADAKGNYVLIRKVTL